VAISPDGTSLYALSNSDDAIARFSRNPSTGALTYQDCLTGETQSGPTGGGGSNACSTLPNPQLSGTNSGFDEPYGIAISPNGASLYVTSNQDDSVYTFSRDLSTGVLTPQSCITGEIATGPTPGNNACVGAFPTRQTSGIDSGLDKVRAMAIDVNGESLYATSGADDSISRFTRDTGTGVLTYQDCLTAETSTGPTAGGGNNSCAALPGITGAGDNSGFDNPQAVTLSPNGVSVYVAAANDASITRFGRTPVTGVLTHQECLSRDNGTNIAACTHLSGGTANGFDSGFDNLRAVVVSPNGDSLYTVGGFDASIVHFSRNTGSGALTFQGCLTRETESGGPNCTPLAGATSGGSNSGWDFASNAPALAVKSDGTGVFFGTAGDRSVVQLDRNTTTGSLTFRRCLTGETESGAGCTLISPAASGGVNTALFNVNGLAISADGGSLYTAASGSDSIARFAFEGPAVIPPVVVPPVAGTPTSAPKRCKKGQKLKKGKCVKRKRKKRGK
jgi:6-phosphogluconolactonase (cycloisomerase 2 family)